MAQIETGTSTAGKVNVDTSFNLNVTLPQVLTSTGFAGLALEYDDGSVTGTRKFVKPRSSVQGRLLTTTSNVMFYDSPAGAVINTQIWAGSTTTQTIAQANGFITLNSGGNVAANTNSSITTKQWFTAPSDASLYFEAECLYTATPQTNQTLTVGFGGGPSINDGIYFQWDSTGTFKAITNFASVLTTSAALTAPALNTLFTLRAYWEDSRALFYVNEKMVAEIATPSGAPRLTAASHLPFVASVLNASSVPASALLFRIGAVHIGTEDFSGNPYIGGHLASYRGEAGYYGLTGGSQGTTANYANSANPTAAVPTNTTAALAAGLGGQFWETDTLAVGTDGLVQSFQVPTGSTIISPKSLVIAGITIDTVVQTAIGAGGYTAAWSLAFGGSAVSLATADLFATSKAYRRVHVGVQAVPANAPVGTVLSRVQIRFDAAPPVVYQGEFMGLVRKKAFGTVPTAGVLAHYVTYDCYYI